MKLTFEILHSAGTKGCGFNRKQLNILGVGWPPRKGWLARLIGTEIDEARWDQVLQLKGKKKKRKHFYRKSDGLFDP